MLFFTQVPSQTYAHPYAYQPYSGVDYYEAAVQRAAQEYASAQARVEHAQRLRLRQQQLRHQFEEAVLGDMYHSAHSYAGGPARSAHPSPSHRRSLAPYALQDLAEAVWREEQHRREAILREREAIRQHAAAEAAARENAARQARTRTMQSQQAALLALLGLAPHVHTEDVQPAIRVPQPAASTAAPAPHPVDRKGKGKAFDIPVEVPVVPKVAHVPVVHNVPTLKEELEARIRTETDPDVQESFVILYSDLFDNAQPSQPTAGPSGTRRESTPAPAAAVPTQQPDVQPKAEPTPTAVPQAEGAPLHRTPVLPPAVAEKLLKPYRARRARRLSLQEIAAIEDALRALEGAFEFPASLDFAPSTPSAASDAGADADSDAGSDDVGTPAYTANNTPVRAYEHALNALLARLDAVESHGDAAVRGRRKAAVREVERALDAVERRVEESRESERERSRESVRTRRVSLSESELTVRPAAPKVEVEVAKGEPVEIVAEDVVVEAEAVEAAAVPLSAADSTGLKVDTAVAPPALATDFEDIEGSNADSPLNDEPSFGEPDFIDTSSADPPRGADLVLDCFGDLAEFEVDNNTTDNDHDETGPSSHDTGVDAYLAEEAGEELDVAAPVNEQLSEDASPASSDPEEGLDVPIPTPDASELALDVPPQDTPTLPPAPILAPEPISRELSTATTASDLTFVTAGSGPQTNTDDSIADMSSPALTEPEAPEGSSAPSPDFSSPSSPSPAFLLSSHPLADPEPKRRRPSAGEDELEIISKDELAEVEHLSGDDWSDVEEEL